jgi:hypothetical protein
VYSRVKMCGSGYRDSAPQMTPAKISGLGTQHLIRATLPANQLSMAHGDLQESRPAGYFAGNFKALQSRGLASLWTLA